MRAPTEATAAAVRAAGWVFGLGLGLGLVPGPAVLLLGVLALLTLGRAAAGGGSPEPAVAAFALMALAIVTVLFRWRVGDLGALRGVQAVLGPSVTVGPSLVAAGCIAAGMGAVAALSVWLASSAPRRGPAWLLVGAEAVVVSLLLVTVFWGPEIPAGVSGLERAGEALEWGAMTLGVAVVALAAAWLQARRPALVRVVLIAATAAVSIAAGIIGGALA